MAIPIADENPTPKSYVAYITLGIIALNVAIFVLFQNGLFNDVAHAATIGFGMIPSIVWGDKILPPEIFTATSGFSIISYMFLHGDLMHLVGNMLILWVFGNNIEYILGRFNYIAFYLLGGIAAALLHATILSGSDTPLIGASGAVSAIGAAYLLIHPKAHIWILLFWLIPIRIPAWAAIGAWFAYQIYASFALTDQAVAWWAHIGGFLFGIAFILLFFRMHISPTITKLIK